MKISASSALVLNWTDYSIYSGPKVRKYIDSLDLSEGLEMLSHFTDEQHYMHTQTVSGRKFFMMKETTAFLRELKEKGVRGQVIVPGAGIAPFSAAIAEMFPDCMVWDIDLYSMKQKSELLAYHFPNIRFLTADLEDFPGWTELLVKEGYDKNIPSIIVLEGITYYLTKPVMKRILSWAAASGMRAIGEFGLPPDSVYAPHRKFPEMVFSTITRLSNHPGISYYERDEFREMLRTAGFSHYETIPMREMQVARTGAPHPFEEDNACWIEPFLAHT